MIRPAAALARAALSHEGKVVTGHYYNTHTDAERFVGASVWDAMAANT